VKDVEAKVRERVALVRKPAATASCAARSRAATSSSISCRSTTAACFAFGRDVTSLKEREEALAAAKEAAERARDDVERTREVMQTVLDNMSDGVTLWDKNFRWMFSNRFSSELWAAYRSTLSTGSSGFDMIASCASTASSDRPTTSRPP
jgi:PAS domain-containing protein